MDLGDPITGQGHGMILCGDVGQGDYEEIDLIEKGANYGWNGYEGYHCFKNKCNEIKGKHTPPIFEYNHSVGISITGGYVYRGKELPHMQGKYIYGDWLDRPLFALSNAGLGGWRNEKICMADKKTCEREGLSDDWGQFLNSFAVDESGEIYLLTTDDFKAEGRKVGAMYKLVDPSNLEDTSTSTGENKELDLGFDVIKEALTKELNGAEMNDIRVTITERDYRNFKVKWVYTLENVKVSNIEVGEVEVELHEEGDYFRIEVPDLNIVMETEYSAARWLWRSGMTGMVQIGKNVGSVQLNLSAGNVRLQTSLDEEINKCKVDMSSADVDAFYNYGSTSRPLRRRALLKDFKKQLKNALQRKVCSTLEQIAMSLQKMIIDNLVQSSSDDDLLS